MHMQNEKHVPKLLERTGTVSVQYVPFGCGTEYEGEVELFTRNETNIEHIIKELK